MTAKCLETDYLVIGAGAMGMAFADTLLDESDATMILVDRHHRPGGHWNHAYPFVRLHQPSAFYGVNSRALGRGAKDRIGLNRGLYEQASAQQILDYFDQVLHARLLPSGRVQFLPMATWSGEGNDGLHVVSSLLDGREQRVKVLRKVVHATHTGTMVPSTHPPGFPIAAGLKCVPPNALPQINRPHARYTIIGGGKTGMDTCLWLLENGTAPDRIRWVISSDSWMIDRANVQPGTENLVRFFRSLAEQFECIAQAESMHDLFDRLERNGQLLRLDPAVLPTRFRCATISQGEMRELRRIRNVVRLGRVQEIGQQQIQLEQGSIDLLKDELLIDCTKCGTPSRLGRAVFEGERAIHLQLIRACAPSFSAAMIAAIECLVETTQEKNSMCEVIPLPNEDRSWLSMWAATLANRKRWSEHRAVMDWLNRSRLDYGTSARRAVPHAIMERYLRAIRAGAPKIPYLLATAGQQRQRKRAEV